jgi:hypothetical protein
MRQQFRFIPAVVLTGLTIDVLQNYAQNNKLSRPLLWLGFLVPVVFQITYFLTGLLTSGIEWTIHVWLGVTVITGAFGLMLSSLADCPAEQR